MNSVVRQLYKNLLFLGREYPEQSGGYRKFRSVLKKNFQSTPIKDESDMKLAIDKARHVEKELEALYFLSKYRHLKRKYYN